MLKAGAPANAKAPKPDEMLRVPTTYRDLPLRAAERAQYLTRDLGLHATTSTDRPWILRLTLVEQSFRRETYRGARVSVIRRL